MAFEKVYITKAGLELEAKSRTGKTIKILRVEVGDGELTDNNIIDKTALIHKKLNCEVNSLQEIDNQTIVNFILQQSNVEEEFYFREFGVIAEEPDTKEEILYMYANAGKKAEFIHDKTSIVVNDRIIDIVVKTNNTDNISISLNNTGVYVEREEYRKKIEELENKINAHEGKIYGVKRNIDNPDPAWERIEDSIGLVANATHDGTSVRNDFDSIYPWSDIISYNYDVESKRNLAYYGEPTFAFDGSNGEVLTEIPQFWYKRERKVEADGNTYEYICIADYKAEGFIKSDQFSVSRYLISEDSLGKIHSKSGAENTVRYTITDARKNAKNIGNEISLLDWHYFLIQLLYVVEYANYDSQSVLGEGNSTVNTGTCDELGMKSGCLNNDGTHSVIYRGIENIFGITYFIDGIKRKDDDHIYICYDSSKYDDNLYEENYKLLGYTVPKNDGYISKHGYDTNNPLILLPIEATNATDSTYLCDAYHTDSRYENTSIVVSGTNNMKKQRGIWEILVHIPLSITYRMRIIKNT